MRTVAFVGPLSVDAQATSLANAWEQVAFVDISASATVKHSVALGTLTTFRICFQSAHLAGTSPGFSDRRAAFRLEHGPFNVVFALTLIDGQPARAFSVVDADVARGIQGHSWRTFADVATQSVNAFPTDTHVSARCRTFVNIFAGSCLGIMLESCRACTLVASWCISTYPVLAKQEVHLTLVNV